MSAINVMKRVKKGGGVPKSRRSPKKPREERVKTFVFPRKNPYSAFHGLQIQDIDDAIEAYIATLNAQTTVTTKWFAVEIPSKVVSVLRTIKTSLPWSVVPDLFNRLTIDEPISETVDNYTRQPDVAAAIDAMRRLLESRRVDGVPRPIVRPTERGREAERRENERKRFARLLKYDKQTLMLQTDQQLAALARRERIPTAGDLSRNQLVNRLASIEIDPTGRRGERPFESEMLPQCESTYRRVPWMSAFTSLPIAGIAVRRDSEYATDIPVVDDWVRAKASFYRVACLIGRDYEPGAVGYFTRSGRVLTETRAMYDASIDWKPPVESVKSVRRVTPVEEERVVIPTRPPATSRSELAEAPAVVKELAPGLFAHVRALISGNVIYCDACNIAIAQPALKSVHGRQRVLFCSSACFESYKFT